MTTSSKVVPQSLSHIISFVSFIVVITLKLSSFFMFGYLFMYLSATQGRPALQKGLTLSILLFLYPQHPKQSLAYTSSPQIFVDQIPWNKLILLLCQ